MYNRKSTDGIPSIRRIRRKDYSYTLDLSGNKTTRIIELIHYLHEWRTMKEIQNHFNVNNRSIARYIQEVISLGYYVEEVARYRIEIRINFNEGFHGKMWCSLSN